MGSCQHASFGIHGGAGLFYALQAALTKLGYFTKVTPTIQQCLNDWGAIIKYMRSCPTSVLQLVKQLLEYIRYSDSCRLSTGGVWTLGTRGIQPKLW